MLATPPILLILGLLAQAEPLPSEMEPPPAAPEPAPSAPVAPAPSAPVEPAPIEPESPLKVGFRAGAEFRISADISPKVGYAFSPFMQYQVMEIAERLGLAARGEFTFSRFSKLVDGDGRQVDRTLSVYDFSALAVATLKLGPVLPWGGVGLGLTMANFSSGEAAYLPGDWSRTRLSLLGAFGVDVKVKDHFQLGVHAEYRGLIDQPQFRLDSGESLKPVGDRLGVGAAAMYQF
jgi:hypothetical protein